MTPKADQSHFRNTTTAAQVGSVEAEGQAAHRSSKLAELVGLVAGDARLPAEVSAPDDVDGSMNQAFDLAGLGVHAGAVSRGEMLTTSGAVLGQRFSMMIRAGCLGTSLKRIPIVIPTAWDQPSRSGISRGW